MSVAVVGFDVDVEAAATDLREQMMFVMAFLINLIMVYFMSKERLHSKLSIRGLFALFLGVDTIIPWLYQVIFTSPSPWNLAILLGLFPAISITISIQLNYKQVVK